MRIALQFRFIPHAGWPARKITPRIRKTDLQRPVFRGGQAKSNRVQPNIFPSASSVMPAGNPTESHSIPPLNVPNPFVTFAHCRGQSQSAGHHWLSSPIKVNQGNWSGATGRSRFCGIARRVASADASNQGADGSYRIHGRAGA